MNIQRTQPGNIQQKLLTFVRREFPNNLPNSEKVDISATGLQVNEKGELFVPPNYHPRMLIYASGGTFKPPGA